MREGVPLLWNTFVLAALGVASLAWALSGLLAEWPAWVTCLSAPFIAFVQFRLTWIAEGFGPKSR